VNRANLHVVNKINKHADTRPISMIWDQDQTKNEFKFEIDGLKAQIKKIDDQINEAKAEEDKTKLLAEQDVLKVRLNELESDYSTDFKKKIYNIATEIMTAMIGELKRVNKL
jgi:seryl-tRNA synthetase